VVGGYTIKNLKADVEDSAPKFGMALGLEGRFATRDLQCEKTGLSYQRLAPNFRIPFGHKQKEQEEVYVLVSGSARVKLDDEIVELQQWDAVRVSREVMRNFEAGPEGAEIIAFGAPRTESQDADMAPDWWSD
jgi:hypothetical protein